MTHEAPRDFVDHALRGVIAEANSLEDKRLFHLAEERYLDAILRIDRADLEHVGTLYNNLGSVARESGRLDAAAAYYQKAIECLRGLKGEAILQQAHAYFNLAWVFLIRKDAKAITFSKQALIDYERYPYTAPADIADARMLLFVTEVLVTRRIEPQDLIATWETIHRVPFSSLTGLLVVQFLAIYSAHLRATAADRYDDAWMAVMEWATGLDEVLTAIDPFRRALAGLPLDF